MLNQFLALVNLLIHLHQVNQHNQVIPLLNPQDQNQLLIHSPRKIEVKIGRSLICTIIYLFQVSNRILLFEQ